MIQNNWGCSALATLALIAGGLGAGVAGCSSTETVGSTDDELTAAQCSYYAQGDRVQICHRTGSARKPYQVIRTNLAACGGHAGHLGDYVASADPADPAYDPTCNGQGCFPEGAPWDGSVECCDGTEPVNGVCADIDECLTNNGGCGVGFSCADNAQVGEPPVCTNIDDCAPDPCQNGGVCTDGVNSHTCACPAGYAGANCETNIDECSPNPCQNDGACTDGVNSYTCTCAPGYTGASCETNIDDCAGNPCLNGGGCTDGVNSYTCTCAGGYTGTNCEVAPVCELPPAEHCARDLSLKFIGDFKIQFSIQTAPGDNAMRDIFAQGGGICGDQALVWHVRMTGAGNIQVESRPPYSILVSSGVAVNDGQRHKVDIRRTDGVLTIAIDCVPAGAQEWPVSLAGFRFPATPGVSACSVAGETNDGTLRATEGMIADECIGSPCRRGYASLGGHCYARGFANASEDAWADGEQACASTGGHLISINSAYENRLAGSMAIGPALIGLTDAGRAVNDFAWFDGSPLTFTHWAAGEPSNSATGTGTEDCALLSTDGDGDGPFWTDVSCATEGKTICEFDHSPP